MSKKHISIIPYYYLKEQPFYKSYFQPEGVYSKEVNKEDILALLEDWNSLESRKLLMGSVADGEIIDHINLIFSGASYLLKVFIQCPNEERQRIKFILDNLCSNYDPGILVAFAGLDNRPPMVWRRYFESVYNLLGDTGYNKTSYTFNSLDKSLLIPKENYICSFLRVEESSLEEECLDMYGLRLPWLVDFFKDRDEESKPVFSLSKSGESNLKFKFLKGIKHNYPFRTGDFLSGTYKMVLDVYTK